MNTNQELKRQAKTKPEEANELPKLRMSLQFSPQDYTFQQVMPFVRGNSQETSQRNVSIQQQMQRSFYVVAPKDKQKTKTQMSLTYETPDCVNSKSDFQLKEARCKINSVGKNDSERFQNRIMIQDLYQRNYTPDTALATTVDQINLLRQYKERMHKAIRIFNEQKRELNQASKTHSHVMTDGEQQDKFLQQKQQPARTKTHMNKRNNNELKNIDQLQSFIKQQVVSFYEQNLVSSPNAAQIGSGMFGLSISRPYLECKGRTIVKEKVQQQMFQIAADSTYKPIILTKPIRARSRPVFMQEKKRDQLLRVQDFSKLKRSKKEVAELPRQLNQYLKQVNDFVNQTLKFKTTITPSHLQMIKVKAKQIGLKFHSTELDARFINSKDFVSVLKKIYCRLNEIIVPPISRPKEKNDPNLVGKYKFWVECQGNNHNLVKSILKRRSWLTWVDVNPDAMWAGVGPQTPNVVWTQVKQKRIQKDLGTHQIYNHVDGIAEIGQKSNFYINMKHYYKSQELNVDDYLPETILVPLNDSFTQDPSYMKFTKIFESGQLWIYKPGEASNRGNGIRVLNDFSKIEEHIMQEIASNGKGNSRYSNFILQRYIMNPMLIERRKFDLRVFALFTAHAESKMMRGYFYNEGYLRTSCKEYDLTKVDNRLIHLTNDAVQKYSADYGKYESSNKLSYAEFEKIISKEKGISFYAEILPKIKSMVTDVFNSVGENLYLPHRNYHDDKPLYNGFELMGFDFMLDDDLNLKIIEVNTNPCLDTPCVLLHRLIPEVLDQTLKLAVDPFTVASQHQYVMNSDFIVSEIKYQLVYESPITGFPSQRLGTEAQNTVDQE